VISVCIAIAPVNPARRGRVPPHSLLGMSLPTPGRASSTDELAAGDTGRVTGRSSPDYHPSQNRRALGWKVARVNGATRDPIANENLDRSLGAVNNALRVSAAIKIVPTLRPHVAKLLAIT
jgi:hypothetical protein